MVATRIAISVALLRLDMTDNDSQPVSDTDTRASEAFALLGHEIRLEILWILGSRDNEEFKQSFGDIRSKMETDIEPSQLHYHLTQLVGHYVEQSDEGYWLRPEGIRLNMDLRAGIVDKQFKNGFFEPAFHCHECESPVGGVVDDGLVVIVCTECKRKYGQEFLEIPQAAFTDEAGAFSFSHFRHYAIQKSISIAQGVCPSCAHPLDSTICWQNGLQSHLEVEIDLACDLCEADWVKPFGSTLLADTELVAFCFEHGIDILSTPYWELEFAATDEYTTVRSTDPWEIALEVTLDDETLELVVDEDLNVVERNRWDETGDENTSLVSDIQNDTAFMDESQEGNRVTLPDEEECLESIRRHRWSDGVTCPRCDGAETTKEGTTNKGTKRYRCHNCDSTFNDLTATIFAHHRLTLPEMFHILREMDRTERAQISQQLDRSSQSVREFIREVEDVRGE